MTIDLQPVRCDGAALARYSTLLSACFGAQPEFTPAALHWLYVQNPDGQAVGFDAVEGGQVVAHYVCVPACVRVDGAAERALLSLNTATHPQWQGRGLFTQLAGRTYQAAAAAGFGSVYGVANANSTPGFVRKLGFQLVAPLQARVGLQRVRGDLAAAAASSGFVRQRSPEAWRWRCANPSNPVAVSIDSAGRRHASARGPFPGVRAYAALAPDSAPASASDRAPGSAASTAGPAHAAALPSARLFLGLLPAGHALPRGYVDIPQRLRPSPLNLIFRDLTARQRQLDAAAVNLNFLDFDAY